MMARGAIGDDPRDSGKCAHKSGMGTGLIPDGRRVPSSRTQAGLVAERAHWHAQLYSMSSPEELLKEGPKKKTQP
jgi:hypothetical protein